MKLSLLLGHNPLFNSHLYEDGMCKRCSVNVYFVPSLEAKKTCFSSSRNFEPQLKHYSRRLHSEDAQSELTLRFIETIHAMNLDSLRSQGDGTIVAYLAQSVRNAYISLLPFKKTVEPPVSWEELTEAQLLGLVAPIREREVLDFSELLDTCPELTKKERKVLTLIYLHGYTSVDIARIVHTTKQNINQVKMRALKKLRRYQ